MVGFQIVATTADNHAANRKALLQLLGGSWKESIANPFKNNCPIYIMFDTAHNMKNIYNNFINRGEFIFPGSNENECCSLSDIVSLIDKETSKAIKLAPQLKPVYIPPSNLDRLSVKPSLAVFNEKTVAALRFYQFPEATSSLILRVLKV